jgi:chemotaxis protein MotB
MAEKEDPLEEDEDEGGGGAPGAPMWMVTFADLMALLLTLFVLLLTFSEMNVIKYKQIAGALKNSFGFAPQDRLAGVIELEGSIILEQITPPQPDAPKVVTDLPPPPEPSLEIKRDTSKEEAAEQVKNALEQKLKRTPNAEEVELERSGEEVVIRFPSRIAFPSGTASVDADFAKILASVVPIIEQTPGEVIVSGHTDNVPLLGSDRFRDNWDLSAARGGAVVRWLIDDAGMDAGRLTVQGFGETRPIVPNDSREGRSRNRRVEISIVVDNSQLGGGGSSLPSAPSAQ